MNTERKELLLHTHERKIILAEKKKLLSSIHILITRRVYNTLPDPPTDQAEIDEWVIQTSKVANRDLRPCYEFWGWTLTDRVKDEVGHLTPYFWKDAATEEWAPARSAFIMKRYPSATRTVTTHVRVE